MTELEDDAKVFGFWIYLMTDLVLFAVLFAAFAVLQSSTFGGPSGKELFQMPTVFAETAILLTSSFTCSLATLALFKNRKNQVVFWFLATFILGTLFLYLEIAEFSQLLAQGNSWQKSAFLSSFFTLVGTHGFHISIGLLWMLATSCTIAFRGLTAATASQMLRLALFWHFLDIVWVFIFTFVYAVGHLA